MFKRLTMPGFRELDRQIAKLRELRDSFRTLNAGPTLIPTEPHAFFPPATEL